MTLLHILRITCDGASIPRIMSNVILKRQTMTTMTTINTVCTPRGDTEGESTKTLTKGRTRSMTTRPQLPPAHAAAIPPFATSSSGVGT